MSEQPYCFADLKALLTYLRNPTYGCPWDLEQTPETIVPHTIEEVFEVVEAIEHQDWTQLLEELGDLLLQIAFYAQMADEQNQFDLNDVVAQLVVKMVRRHPHVFPRGQLEQPCAELFPKGQQAPMSQIKARWEQIKSQELAEKKENGSSKDCENKLPLAAALDRLPKILCAAGRAQKVQSVAAKKGLDWAQFSQVRQCLSDEIKELDEALSLDEPVTEHVAEELGDILFSCVNLARHLKLDAAQCLRQSIRKFETRARGVEALWCSNNPTKPMDEAPDEALEDLWRQYKTTEVKKQQ